MSVWEELSKVEPKRDRYGRPLVTPRDGGKPVAYTRPTTIADTLDDRHNLELWMQRQVALGLVARPDLIARAATTDPTDKSTLNAICSDARDAAGSSAAANMGTAIHAAVEAHNRGQEPPEMFAEVVERYRQTLERHGITVDPDHVEQFCVNEPVKAAGTFDMIVAFDGRNYIADLKTGSSVAWSGRSFAVQLAIYAGATSYYDPATETHTDPVEVDQDRALIVHLPAGGDDCTLYWLDIHAGREALEHALWVRTWRRNDRLLFELDTKPKAVRKAVRKPKRTLEPVPMPPLPESTSKPKAKAKAVKATPEEGEVVPMEKVAELRARATDPTVKAIIARWVAESREADCDFGMSLVRSERRFAISQACVELAETDDDEWARAVLALVVGDDAQKPSVTVGQVLGKLTQTEAERVTEIATTASAHYSDDGRLIVQVAS